MLFKVIYPITSQRFSAGLDSSIDKLAESVGRTSTEPEALLSDWAGDAYDLYERAQETASKVKSAFGYSMVIYIALSICLMSCPSGFQMGGGIAIALCLFSDWNDVRSIEANARRHAMRKGIRLLIRSGERIVASKRKGIIKRLLGYLGEYESKGGEEVWKPYEWFEFGAKGVCLIWAANGSDTPWRVLRWVRCLGGFSGELNARLVDYFTPRAKRWGLGFSRTFHRSTSPEVQMESIPEGSTLSDRILLRKVKRTKYNSWTNRMWAKLFFLENGAGMVTAMASGALIGLASLSLYERRWPSQRQDSKNASATKEYQEKVERSIRPGARLLPSHGSKESFLSSAKDLGKLLAKQFDPDYRMQGYWTMEMRAADRELLSRYGKWAQKARKFPKHPVLKERADQALEDYNALWRQWRDSPDPSAFVPVNYTDCIEEFLKPATGVRKEPQMEAKGKQAVKGSKARKTGRTSDGNKFWVYDSETAEGAIFVYQDGEDALFEGDEDAVSAYMRRKGDYFDEESFESAPAKGKKALAKERKESSLGRASIDTSKVKMLMLRKKGDDSTYQNAPIFEGKVIVYLHTFGKTFKQVEDRQEQFELWDPVKKRSYDLGKGVQMKTDKECLVYKAPEGLKSNTWSRAAPSDTETHDVGSVVGYSGLDATHLTVSPGEVRFRSFRHTCATKPGDCGSLVFSSTGDAPRCVGIHLYGDDGSKQNGYVAFTKEFNEELREVTFPKN